MTTHQHLFSIRLPKVQRGAIYLVLIMVAASGVSWSLLHDVLQWGWMLAERRLLILHGVTAAASLVLIGSLLPLHFRLAWRTRHNRASGVAAIAMMSLLGITALLLYYGGEEWRDGVRWTHVGVGFIAVLIIPIHIGLGRRRAARQIGRTGRLADDVKVERPRA